MEKDERIQLEIKRLDKICKDLVISEKGTIAKLIDNIAFMSVTLEDLMEQINKESLIVKVENGSQVYLKENPAITAYNKLFSNFNKGIQQLISLLPVNPAKTKDEDSQDELMEFLNRKKRKK